MRQILFDLDGTLTDPAEGITKSVAHALRSFGIDVPELSELNCFIGPPLADSFMERYGFSREKAMLAIERYREYFAGRGIFENRIYPGVPEMLASLQGRARITLATSKPTVFAKRILEHFSIARFFDDVVGSELDGRRTDKAEVIADALAPDMPAAMVGDRKHDAAGAAKNNIPCVGVLYGYGSRAELEAAGVSHICESVEALSEYLSCFISQ